MQIWFIHNTDKNLLFYTQITMEIARHSCRLGSSHVASDAELKELTQQPGQTTEVRPLSRAWRRDARSRRCCCRMMRFFMASSEGFRLAVRVLHSLLAQYGCRNDVFSLISCALQRSCFVEYRTIHKCASLRKILIRIN